MAQTRIFVDRVGYCSHLFSPFQHLLLGLAGREMAVAEEEHTIVDTEAQEGGALFWDHEFPEILGFGEPVLYRSFKLILGEDHVSEAEQVDLGHYEVVLLEAVIVLEEIQPLSELKF